MRPQVDEGALYSPSSFGLGELLWPGSKWHLESAGSRPSIEQDLRDSDTAFIDGHAMFAPLSRVQFILWQQPGHSRTT